MARRRIEEQNIRSINKIGNGGYSITLPIAHVRSLRWQERQKVVVELDEKTKRLVIRDWKR